jgi:pilus assembly protein Flp/PilA
LRDESGATAIEYAIIAVFASIAIIGGATTLGTKLSSIFTSVKTGFH